MNVFVAYGRLCNDVDLRYTMNGTAVGKFSMAVNRQHQSGEKKADYFNMTCFGKTAENIGKFFRKGSRIVVKCHAQQEEYSNKDGYKINTVGFIVDSFSFVDTRAEGGIMQNQNTYTSPAPENMEDNPGFMNIPDGIDDELPFQ